MGGRDAGRRVVAGRCRANREITVEVSSRTIPVECDGCEGHYGDRMGFNPHRQHKRTNADYLLVAAAFIVCALLLAWAVFG